MDMWRKIETLRHREPRFSSTGLERNGNKIGMNRLSKVFRGFGKVSDTIASLDAALFPDKKGKGGGKAAGKAAEKPEVDEADPFA